MPVYLVCAETKIEGENCDLFVDAKTGRHAHLIYRKNIQTQMGVSPVEINIKNIYEIPTPTHAGKVLPWSDLDGVWSVMNEVEDRVSNYTVVGRAYGDDEATVLVFNNMKWSEAIDRFNEKLAPPPATLEKLRTEEMDEYFTGVFIDAVIKSDSEMSEA